MFNCIATETCKFLRRVLKAVSGVVGNTWPCSIFFYSSVSILSSHKPRHYFKICPSVYQTKLFKAFFLFIAPAAILFNGAERFEPFW